LKITGVDVFDSLLKPGSSTLFYGLPGIGKTTMLLTIAVNLCRGVVKCLYVNTEDVLFYERVAKYSDRYSNVFFIDILDFDELYDFTVTTLPRIPVQAVFIDSVNSLFRVSAYRENTLSKYAFILGLIKYLTVNNNIYVFSTAQIRSGFEDEDEFVASGMNILDFWFDNIFKMNADSRGRFVEVVKPRGLNIKRYYIITDEGILWMR